MERVLIVGSDRQESLESCYARAFTQLDWQVRFWDPALALQRVVRGGRAGRLFSLFVHIEPWLRKANVELLQIAEQWRPDLLLVIATTGIRAGTLAQLKGRQPDLKIYSVYPDSPHNLDADRIHCLPFFDGVTTSSPAWISAFKQLGARQVAYLPFAADTQLYRPTQWAKPERQLAHAVTFVGTWRLEREQVLEQLVEFDLRIWGSAYWKNRVRPGSPLKHKWGGRALVGDEFCQACTHSKINLNILDSISWPGPNMRAFELPACNAFALVERTAAVLEIFQEGKTIECFTTTLEARDKIAYYLQHEAERLSIAQAGYEFVTQQGHTYNDRVRQLLMWAQVDGRSG
jgi:spore maturation protein CgeB